MNTTKIKSICAAVLLVTLVGCGENGDDGSNDDARTEGDSGLVQYDGREIKVKYALSADGIGGSKETVTLGGNMGEEGFALAGEPIVLSPAQRDDLAATQQYLMGGLVVSVKCEESPAPAEWTKIQHEGAQQDVIACSPTATGIRVQYDFGLNPEEIITADELTQQLAAQLPDVSEVVVPFNQTMPVEVGTSKASTKWNVQSGADWISTTMNISTATVTGSISTGSQSSDGDDYSTRGLDFIARWNIGNIDYNWSVSTTSSLIEQSGSNTGFQEFKRYNHSFSYVASVNSGTNEDAFWMVATRIGDAQPFFDQAIDIPYSSLPITYNELGSDLPGTSEQSVTFNIQIFVLDRADSATKRLVASGDVHVTGPNQHGTQATNITTTTSTNDSLTSSVSSPNDSGYSLLFGDLFEDLQCQAPSGI